MKKTIRCLSCLLVCLLFLTACTGGTETPDPTTAPTTLPTTPPAPVFGEYDPDRPLPTLAAKFVSQDAADGNFIIAKDGEPVAKVVIPADCSIKVELAADDLLANLRKMVGMDFELIYDNEITDEGYYILLGPTSKTLELGEGTFEEYPADERYTIRRHENFLILCGNDGGNFECTGFAVTRLLEEAGCGWFAPSAMWHVIPKTPNLSIAAVDKDFTPRFQSRNMGVGSVSGRWYLGGYNTINGHTLPGWFPYTAYAEHPEFYALVGDSREPDPNEYWHFCYTNPDFAAAVAQKVIEHFDRSTNATQMTMSITANDGWNKFWCECETCVNTGNHADQMLLFANNVAAITSKVYPEKKVSILAYHDTFLPPQKQNTVHPNVEIMFCLETAPFADLSKDEIIHEGYNSVVRFEFSDSWKGNYEAWIEQTGAKNVSIWAWYCIGAESNGWRTYPWVQGNAISNMLDMWEEMGMREIFVDCGNDPADLRWPLFYAAAKCMWEPDLTAEDVLYEACVKLFGAAADDMFLYYRHLADAAAQHGAVAESIVWVPPKVTTVYSEDYAIINDAITAAQSKLDQLTLIEQNRIKNQANYWANVYAVFGS